MSAASHPDPDRPAERVLEVGGRLACGPSDRLIHTAFKKELEAQADLFEPMGLADLAHTLVLTETGVIPRDAGGKLLAALLRLQERPDDFILDPARGDLYTNREAWLAQHCDVVGWLGAGRARREASTAAFFLQLRENLLGLMEALTATGRAMAARAAEFRATLMPDYTYLLAAQPTTFGHYLLGFVYPLLRDLARIQALYQRVNRSPAGCGSSNGSRLPQNRQRLAELLGFDGLVEHGRDAMWQADLPIETAAVLTSALVNLDRLAEDLQVFSTEEFGLVELDDRHARASKIMPQKKNPFALTHVRCLTNTMLGTLTTSTASGRTPSGQPDNRLALYGLIPRAIGDTRDAAGLMGEVLQFLDIHEDRARSRLADCSALATDLAEVLVLESGLDFRQAHRLVGHLVRSRASHLEELTPEDLADAAQQTLGRRVELSATALRDALNPQAAVAARNAPGGAAPESMSAMLCECEKAFAEGETWTRQCRQRLVTAQDALLAQVRKAAAR